MGTLAAENRPLLDVGGATGRLPDFIVVGAMKAGTTALYDYLRQRRDVFMPYPKEPSFFSYPEAYRLGPQWYASLFADARPDQICGEASPSYARYPRFPASVERMARLVPHVKLVYLLRHPVDRFYSNYVHDRSYGYNGTIQETLEERPWVLETSNYMMQIRRFLDYFPRAQLHIAFLDDLPHPGHLHSQASATIIELLDFLGLRQVPTAKTCASVRCRSNQRGSQRVALHCAQALDRLRQAPGASAAARLIPTNWRLRFRSYWTEQFPHSSAGLMLANRFVRRVEPLTTETRVMLLKQFAASTRELEEFVGRSLDPWRV